MTRLSIIFPKSPIEPSWDRAQVAKALRLQRHRHKPLEKAAQVLGQWAIESRDVYDSRDLSIISAQLAEVAHV